MAQKRKPDQTKVIIEAALSHADKVGWAGLTLQNIAARAKVDIKAVERVFPDKWAVLKKALETLDAAAAKNVQGALSAGAWRDNLFEILMARFDLMEKHRGAFASLAEAFLREPNAAAKFARTYGRSMQAMLKLADAPATPLHTLGFGALYASLVEAWKNDDTPDLSKTMAAVDKRLGIFEKATEYLKCKV